MTIRERDKELDREHIAKTGHSIHEARWAMNPCYDPDQPIPFQPSPMQEVIGVVIINIVMTSLLLWWVTRF